MAIHRVYFRKEQELEIQKQANRLGLEVNDLIKARLDLDNQTDRQSELQALIQELKTLKAQIERIEQMQRDWYQFAQSLWVDIAFTRGALEAQASTDSKERGEELEGRRLRQFQKMQAELAHR